MINKEMVLFINTKDNLMIKIFFSKILENKKMCEILEINNNLETLEICSEIMEIFLSNMHRMCLIIFSNSKLIKIVNKVRFLMT